MGYRSKVIYEDKFGGLDFKVKELKIKDVAWRYSVSGQGSEFLLAIMANIGGHVFALPLAEAFSHKFTTIALSVPPKPRFADTAEGLAAILTAENIPRCNVIGHSNGTVHLQSLIHTYPTLVNQIVFSHGLTSMHPDDAYTVNASEARVYKALKKALKVLPVSVLVKALSRQILKKIVLKAGEAETERMRNICKAELKRISKQDLLTIAECMEDFLYHYTFTDEPYRHKPEKVLIIDSATDKVVNPMQRASMRKLCPQAKEYHFTTGGHLTLVHCQDEYFNVLTDFWE
ncbi:alpha/beta fold hydrolase [Paenibacillus dendritiformis]|uniref:alpha/beta fold hydrolase n=1 Tax=Paenibacillus dendritiformis TaxID=130049 RepID=UPI003659F8A4